MSYVVVYGRFVDDKQDGVFLEGIYFGGVAERHDEADEIATNCVNNAKRGTSFPKIMPIDEPGNFPRIMQEAADRFFKMEAAMIEAEDIHRANQEMAKRRRIR